LTVSTKHSGKFVNLLKSLRAETATTFGGQEFLTGYRGKSQLICLEEQLRTDSLNPITIQYERQLKIGGFCKLAKGGSLTTQFGTQELNNL